MKNLVFGYSFNESGKQRRMIIEAPNKVAADSKFHGYLEYGYKIGFYQEEPKEIKFYVLKEAA